jgi:hypothetical protein
VTAAAADVAAGDGGKIDGIPAPRPGGSEGAGSVDGAPNGARTNGTGMPADSVGTRRKSVVFEEDDELDIPDFLK